MKREKNGWFEYFFFLLKRGFDSIKLNLLVVVVGGGAAADAMAAATEGILLYVCVLLILDR